MNDFFEPSLLDFSGFESDGEFIPLATAEEEENVNKQTFPEHLPILPLQTMCFWCGDSHYRRKR